MSAKAAEKEKSDVRSIALNPDLKSPRVTEFESRLGARIVGQERAVRMVADIYQMHLAGLASPNRPVGTMLFLGPTGSGKTRVVEAAAEVLFGDPQAVIKIDCAEFQHGHEISKLIGSPPGYLGHRETIPLLSQENLDRYHTADVQLSLVLFDEIEKASDSLWQLLLGILDKATLTLGDNRRVDFSRAIIFMTSNLGAREMAEMVEGHLGFAPPAREQIADGKLDQQMYRTASEAARRKFSPEFMNRIDKLVVFRRLTTEHLREILDLEIDAVQQRILRTAETKFVFECTPAAREFLLREGTDLRYGARHLKRAIERFVVFPLANLVASGQIGLGDLVRIDAGENQEKLCFTNEREGSLAGNAVVRYPEYFHPSRLDSEWLTKAAMATAAECSPVWRDEQ